MTWREITPEQLIELRSPLIVDVRSPCEYEDERIPHAINLPLLSNEERAEIGIRYKEDGELVARRRALHFIAPKIAAVVDHVAQIRERGRPLVVHCWRGGLRSEAVASILSIAGLDCYRLTGGYKAWRSLVLKCFKEDAYPFTPVVLVGLTGTGKTEILRGLAARQHRVIDLESLANHRGSVFGALGLPHQPTQKNFDGLLFEELRKAAPGPIFLEGESRKLGKISLPDCIHTRVSSGPHVLITGSLRQRAQRIADQYLNLSPADERQAKLNSALELLIRLKERLGHKALAQIKELVNSDDIITAIEILLVQYYDPLYSSQIESLRPFALEVNGDTTAEAIDQIHKWTSTAATPSSSR